VDGRIHAWVVSISAYFSGERNQRPHLLNRVADLERVTIYGIFSFFLSAVFVFLGSNLYVFVFDPEFLNEFIEMLFVFKTT
jgi:hypothetical protein